MSSREKIDSASEVKPVPSLLWMHGTFILTGLGTFLLGPILPLLSRHWHLADSQSGLLLLAQFCGSFCGGITTSGRLRRGLAIGLAAAILGLGLFALSPALPAACTGLAIAGFGVGRSLTAINIIAARRFTSNRASELNRLNFSWSFGALLSPLLAAWLTPHATLRTLFLTFASLFLVSIVLLWAQTRKAPPETQSSEDNASLPGLPARVFLYFLAILFVYGGLETSLSGWLTTFALRYGTSSLALSEYTLVLLLIGLTAGRALASALLLQISDLLLLRVALVLSAVLAAALATAHAAASIAIFAILLGLSLAPVFPVTFAILIGHHPRARQASAVIAVSGLGAAALPWLMGVLSTRTGSLQQALGIPVAAALLLLALTMFPPKPSHPTNSSS